MVNTGKKTPHKVLFQGILGCVYSPIPMFSPLIGILTDQILCQNIRIGLPV